MTLNFARYKRLYNKLYIYNNLYREFFLLTIEIMYLLKYTLEEIWSDKNK